MIFQNFGFNAISKPSPLPPLSIDWLLIGGGASGGTSDQNISSLVGGGGGAGRFVSASQEIQPGSISITVGAGGAARTARSQGDNGDDSEMTIAGITYISYGGGGGGEGVFGIAGTRFGRPGGSGGGGASASSGSAFGGYTGGEEIEGEPIVGFGNPGGTTGVGTWPLSGYGGGAGTDRSGREWLDGVTYCIGGPGYSSGDAEGTTAGCGSSGSITADSNAGKNGVCIIRYAGTGSQATGGTISYSNGYTYHTFNSNGTFTY
jgi:hypothetical protein